MAWTWQTATFFAFIAVTLLVFIYLGIKFPEMSRKGILGFSTTRGDRLFVTLLGSAFINVAWLGLTDTDQYYALIFCLLFAFLVFRWV